MIKLWHLFAFDQTLFFLAVSVVFFHSQIKQMWETGIRFVVSILNEILAIMILVVAAMFTGIYFLKQSGSYALTEYAANHVNPIVCMLLFNVALFLIYLITYSIFTRFKTKEYVFLTEVLMEEKLFEASDFFKKPLMILLQ